MLHSVGDLIAIGEFSELSGLSSRRLRTYAAEGLLVPAAIDPASGYRYYSLDQLPTARLIEALRQADIPLAEIGTFLRTPSQQRLDAWAGRLEAESRHRVVALENARTLLERDGAPKSLTPRAQVKEAAMPVLRTASRTEKGSVRENNEDAVVALDRLGVVADGMGGHPGGEIAAADAAGIARAGFGGVSSDELRAVLRAANWAIWNRAATDPDLEGMGTTICAVGLLADGVLAVANVGDSRAYLWRDGSLSQLTRDHTVTAELIERGELHPDAEPQHPHYGVLTRALGVAPDIDIDCTSLRLEAGDRVMLCSDGLFREVPEDEMVKIFASREGLASLADRLVERALDNGGRDNVSVVIAETAE
jgi:PPM family protein phosphatase